MYVRDAASSDATSSDTRTTYWAVATPTTSSPSTSTHSKGSKHSETDASNASPSSTMSNIGGSTALTDDSITSSTPQAEWTTTVYSGPTGATAKPASLLSSPYTLGALAGAAAAGALVIAILLFIWWRCRCVRRKKAKQQQQQSVLDDLVANDFSKEGAKPSSPSFVSPGSFGPARFQYHTMQAAMVPEEVAKRVKFAGGYRFDDIVLEEKQELMDPHDTSGDSYSPPPSPTKMSRSPHPPLPLSMRTVKPMSSTHSLTQQPRGAAVRGFASRSTPHLPLASPDQSTPENGTPKRGGESGHLRYGKNSSTGSKETMASQYSTQSGEGRRNTIKRLTGWRQAYESPRAAPKVPAVPRNPQAFLWRPVNNSDGGNGTGGKRILGRPMSEFAV